MHFDHIYRPIHGQHIHIWPHLNDVIKCQAKAYAVCVLFTITTLSLGSKWIISSLSAAITSDCRFFLNEQCSNSVESWCHRVTELSNCYTVARGKCQETFLGIESYHLVRQLALRDIITSQILIWSYFSTNSFPFPWLQSGQLMLRSIKKKNYCLFTLPFISLSGELFEI